MSNLDRQLVIRRARFDDIDAIVPLHCAIAREAYRELAPAGALDALDAAYRRRTWTARLTDPKPEAAAFVAEIECVAVGFGNAGPPCHPGLGDRGEIVSLFVDRSSHRQGIGRALMTTMARHLASSGFRELALTVIVGNDPAIAFYERMGGRRVGLLHDPDPPWPSTSFVYVWNDLSVFGVKAANGARP